MNHLCGIAVDCIFFTINLKWGKGHFWILETSVHGFDGSLIGGITDEEKPLFGGMAFKSLGGFIEVPLWVIGGLLVFSFRVIWQRKQLNISTKRIVIRSLIFLKAFVDICHNPCVGDSMCQQFRPCFVRFGKKPVCNHTEIDFVSFLFLSLHFGKLLLCSYQFSRHFSKCSFIKTNIHWPRCRVRQWSGQRRETRQTGWQTKQEPRRSVPLF